MSFTISAVNAREILDSRGRPTLHVRVALGHGAVGEASVPSGASTGSREAVELRDGDETRFSGAGVTKAARLVETDIADRVQHSWWRSLADLDAALVELDGTDNKSRLGANAIVGVSMAIARACAVADGRPLYKWLADDDVQSRLPVPHFNVINGGVHAPNKLEFQEFMIAPVGAQSMADAVRAGAEIYAALRKLLTEAGLSTGLGDEGGFAPEIDTPEQACELLVRAIESAGYTAARNEVAIALDPAASEFAVDLNDGYRIDGEPVSSDALIGRYAALIEKYPIWSLEDGLSEDDEPGWLRLTEQLGKHVQIVGDDLLVTNPTAIRAGIAHNVANAALIKLNQVGTVSETLQALRICRQAGWGAMISHRSGETPDTFIADLAVASGCGQIKAGAPARGERVAKYNRLTQIAAADPDLPYGLP
jgi:enolase